MILLFTLGSLLYSAIVTNRAEKMTETNKSVKLI